MKGSRSITMLLMVVVAWLCFSLSALAADCGDSLELTSYPLGCSFSWGAPNSGDNASNLDFVSTWVGYESRGGLDGDCDGCRLAAQLTSEKATLVYYTYMIGFQANLMGGFGDCNVDYDGHNLCTDGAQWIRDNWDLIVQMYGEYAQRTYEASPDKPVIWWLEGDYVQYSYDTQSNPLSMAELGQLARDITCAIKANEPNAVVAMNHSPWISDEQADAFWSAMPMDVIDLVWVQGAGDTGAFVNSGSYNAATANYAWLYQKAGAPIMAETSYASSGQPDRWSTTTADNINARIAEGVIAVLVNNPGADYLSSVQQLTPQLNAVCDSGGSTEDDEIVAVTGVSVTPSSASVDVGATTTLVATVSPGNATDQNVTWSSSDTGIATVSAAGAVTGVAQGSATITVATQNGSYTTTCAVTVTATGSGDDALGTCDSPTSATLPLVINGDGEYCRVTSGDISNINSWNMQLVEINGETFTNTWSNKMPAKINGNYYIHYVGKYSWSHLEINDSGGSSVSVSIDKAQDSGKMRWASAGLRAP